VAVGLSGEPATTGSPVRVLALSVRAVTVWPVAASG
jgi:hypothetical protein